MPFRQLTRTALIDKLRMFEKENGMLHVLDAIQIVHATDIPNLEDTAYWIIQTCLDPMKVFVHPFVKQQRTIAKFMYFWLERSDECKSGKTQVVMVSADSITKLKKAYPNFFLDIEDFVKKVAALIE